MIYIKLYSLYWRRSDKLSREPKSDYGKQIGKTNWKDECQVININYHKKEIKWYLG
jgi:hypothetical protein